MQGFDDLCGEPPDICGGNMGAFRDLKGIEGDQINGSDFPSLKRGNNVRVRSSREVWQD